MCHRDYNAALANLYSSKAQIEQIGRLDGSDRVFMTLRLDPKQWKKLMPKLMTEAQAKGDRSLFSNWAFEEQSQCVVITATRFSELKGYSVPHRLVIAKADDGDWLIVEETMNVLKQVGVGRMP